MCVFDFDALEGGLSNRRSVVPIPKTRGTRVSCYATNGIQSPTLEADVGIGFRCELTDKDVHVQEFPTA